jgi:hypothetical protein
MFEALAGAIDELEIGVDDREIAAALRLRDRFEAKLVAAVAQFDAAELWDVDGSVSLTAWLRHRGQLTNADAQRLATTARKLRSCPHTLDAWVTGSLDGGQIAVITACVTDRLLPIYTQTEEAVVDLLAGEDLAETRRLMQAWAVRAEGLVGDDPDPDVPRRALHLSPTLDGRGRLDADLDPEAHELLRRALAVTETKDVEGEPARTPAERRADALVDVLRWFLDHQSAGLARRHRPHLNVVITLPDLQKFRGGTTLDGTPLDGPTIRRLLCDAGVHRVITDGKSSVLDYGRATRTIPPAVYTSLVLRDLGCRFPGCDRPAEWTEGHHIEHWEHGGTTCLQNLVLLCSRHHHLIHLKGWHIKLLPHGTIEVTAPDGTLRTSDPPPPRP